MAFIIEFADFNRLVKYWQRQNICMHHHMECTNICFVLNKHTLLFRFNSIHPITTNGQYRLCLSTIDG